MLSSIIERGDLEMMDSTVWIGLAFALFVIGLYCVSKPNMIRILLGIEIILNSGNLLFVYFASANNINGFVDPIGQSIVIMSIVTGGCVVAVGLTLIVNAYKQYKTTDSRELRRLRW
jgi:multisubunit Na+/H+ antiporter MnhC subunit